MEAEDAAPTLASARVAAFYDGVYKQFLVQGPATYHLKIGRCYSFCTKLQGIFLDKIPGSLTATVPMPLIASPPPPTGLTLPNITWRSHETRPAFPMARRSCRHGQADDDPITAARALWSALDSALGSEGGSAVQTRDRVLAYRAALAAQASPALLANWRWSLCLWTAADRAEFNRVMPHLTPTPQEVVPKP